MAKKWNMIIDGSRCENCRNCFLVTKDEHIGNEFPGYAASQPLHGHSWIDLIGKERGTWPIVEANFIPVLCNHCDDAPCMKVAKNGAISKRDDGIVIIDPEKSKGQKEIVAACPYEAVYWNEEKQIPQAWIFDAHLLDQGWTKTRVEHVCPTGVYKSIKVEDAEMQRIKEREGLEVLQPEKGTKPRVYYKNLHLMTKCFVSGSVVSNAGAVEDCFEGAEVILNKDGSEIARAKTDAFGEFKIDKLEQESNGYDLEIRADSHAVISMEFKLGADSVYLGLIRLDENAN